MTALSRFCCCTLCVLLVSLSDADASAKDQFGTALSYNVDFSNAKNHYVNVTLDAVANDDETELLMAVWTPGSYLVREYARHLDSLHVTGADETVLEVRKTRKNRWLVQTKPGEPFRVTYRLYCNEVSVRTNFVQNRYAVLNGAPTFLTVLDQMNAPHKVQLKMPEDWQQSATSLTSGEAPNYYIAKNFDELVDSPIVAGYINVYPFEVDGVPHQLVNVGENGYWNGTKAASDLKQIVKQQKDLWRTLPYHKYLFINVICEASGGLEHDSCTLMMASRWAFRLPDFYEDWLSLASHEFFHAWNVRRLRPKPLMSYDYENEVYSDSLWIAEGITNYYEDLILVRAGLIDRKIYLKRLSKHIDKVQRANGRRIQSLRDASFDAWIKHYRPDENSSNTQVSYYAKGAIAAFLLDAEIRKATLNSKSLDDVMRLMFDRFAQTGYTESDFRITATEVAGIDLANWFDQVIDSTKELDYELAQQWLGLTFEAEEGSKEEADVKDTKARENETDEEKKDEPKPWLGIEVTGSTISKVDEGGPAFDSGINTSDELIAINGFRIKDSLKDHLKQFSIGDQIDVTVSRSGELMEFPVTISQEIRSEWLLRVSKSATTEQTNNVNSWTNGSLQKAMP